MSSRWPLAARSGSRATRDFASRGNRLVVRVSIDASEANAYLNGERFTLQLDPETTTRPIPQTGPGRYELSLESPGRAAIARVRHGGQLLDAVALAGRYAPEFDAAATTRAALGGARAPHRRRGDRARHDPPAQPAPGSRRAASLVSFLATAGAALICRGPRALADRELTMEKRGCMSRLLNPRWCLVYLRHNNLSAGPEVWVWMETKFRTSHRDRLVHGSHIFCPRR